MAVQARCSFRRTRMQDRRCRKLSLRLSDVEYDALRRGADSHQLAVGAYAARVAVAHAQSAAGPGDASDRSESLRELHVELAQAWTAISRVGTNVNQLAKVANSTGEVDHARLGPTLAFVRRALSRVEEACLEITGRLQ